MTPFRMRKRKKLTLVQSKQRFPCTWNPSMSNFLILPPGKDMFCVPLYQFHSTEKWPWSVSKRGGKSLFWNFPRSEFNPPSLFLLAPIADQVQVQRIDKELWDFGLRYPQIGAGRFQILGSSFVWFKILKKKLTGNNNAVNQKANKFTSFSHGSWDDCRGRRSKNILKEEPEP